MNQEEVGRTLADIFSELKAIRTDTALSREEFVRVATKLDNHLGAHHSPDICPRMNRHDDEHRQREEQRAETERMFWTKLNVRFAIAGVVFGATGAAVGWVSALWLK